MKGEAYRERGASDHVQGEAEAPDTILTSPNHLPEYWRRLFGIQPAGEMYGPNWLMRRLMNWHYMRFYISVRSGRTFYWPKGDFARSPPEVGHVG